MKSTDTYSPETASRYGWVILATFTINSGVVIIGISTLGLLLPDISDEFSLSPTQKGWLASSILLMNLILDIPLNWWLSHYRPRIVSAISFMASSLLVLAIASAPSYALLLLSRIGLGFFILATRPTRTLIIYQWFGARQIGRANGFHFSLFEAIDGSGAILIPLILVMVDDWRITLYAWAVVCVVSAFVWLLVSRDRPASIRQERASSDSDSPMRSLFKFKVPWIMGVGIAGAGASEAAFTAFWPTLTTSRYGTALTVAGVILGLMFMARSPGILTVTSIPFFSRRTPLVLVLGGVLLCGTYLSLVYTGSLFIIFLVGTINGLSYCFWAPMLTIVYNLPGIKPREIAVSVALMGTFQWIGASLGPLVVGFTQESTGSLAFGMTIMSLTPLLLVLAGLLTYINSRIRTEKQPARA